MKRRSACDNALNSPTLLLLGSCLQAAFPRKTGLGWGELLGAAKGGKNNRDDVVSGVLLWYSVNFTLGICPLERCNKPSACLYFSMTILAFTLEEISQ